MNKLIKAAQFAIDNPNTYTVSDVKNQSHFSWYLPLKEALDDPMLPLYEQAADACVEAYRWNTNGDGDNDCCTALDHLVVIGKQIAELREPVFKPEVGKVYMFKSLNGRWCPEVFIEVDDWSDRWRVMTNEEKQNLIG